MQAVKVFEDCGGLVGLETLEYANNEPLRQQADNILDTYFYKDEENGTVFVHFICCIFVIKSFIITRGVQKVLQLDHKKERKRCKLHFILQYNLY